jgi:hypothetical protein
MHPEDILNCYRTESYWYWIVGTCLVGLIPVGLLLLLGPFLLYLFLKFVQLLGSLLAFCVGVVSGGIGQGFNQGTDFVLQHRPKPARVVVHYVEDKHAAQLAELERRYEANVRVILNSKLPQDVKERMLEEELNVYETRLRENGILQ